MTALLVEDMPQALDSLRRDLADVRPDVEVIGTAESVVAAAKLLRQQQPDLLLLDVSLGDGTSFDLLEIFPDLRSQLIFITASEDYALRAFRFAAVDYLLKPIDPAQLAEAVGRAEVRLRQPAAGQGDQLAVLRDTLRAPGRPPDRISLHTAENITVVRIADIIRCEADGNNTRVVIDGHKPVYVTKTLKHYDRLLADHDFLRVHQSHLVNFDHITEFRKVDSGYLRLSNGEEVPVASRKRALVVDRLR